MFPVPDHLPRVPPASSERAALDEPNLALDLLAPFSGTGGVPAQWTAAQATAIREKLEEAVKENKVRRSGRSCSTNSQVADKDAYAPVG
jgi:hypothetical protein